MATRPAGAPCSITSQRRSHGRELHGRVGGAPHFPDAFYAVNMACFDDLTDEFKAALTIQYQDGRHDDWQSEPPAVEIRFV